MSENFVYFADTRAGTFKLVATNRGLLSIDFPKKGTERRTRKLPVAVKKNCKIAEKWLIQYFRSSARAARLPKIDDERWSTARKRMTKELFKIKSGKTHSYQELAKSCGIPKGPRAIGQLLGSNPLPVLVPCHRILRSDGQLGGFSGGLEWKKKLLRHERVLK